MRRRTLLLIAALTAAAGLAIAAPAAFATDGEECCATPRVETLLSADRTVDAFANNSL